MSHEAGRTVVIVGAGGNIGSHLVPHIARMAGVERLVLVDPDAYEARNLASQAIGPDDVGRPKVRVQARRARRIAPALAVVPLAERVEDLPLGWLRADLILGCLDSRAARQTLNRAAWRLGIPWIDGGLLADGLLARIDVYRPSPEAACLECAWDEADYAALEQAYPCDPAAAAAPPTAGPSGLGGLVAALQALECLKLLDERPGRTTGQLVLDAAHHRLLCTVHRRNPACRLAEHVPWRIERLSTGPRGTTLHSLLRRVRDDAPGDPVQLWVEGKRFVRELRCPRCGRTLRLLALAGERAGARCGVCGERLVGSGFGSLDRLSSDELPAEQLERPLCELGLRSGEVVNLARAGEVVHLELGLDRPELDAGGCR